MNLIPRRVVRRPEECQTLWTIRQPDTYRDGVFFPGAIIERKQRAGTGWWWLARMWLWRDWKGSGGL